MIHDPNFWVGVLVGAGVVVLIVLGWVSKRFLSSPM